MKKIILVNSSPRKGGNSETIVDMLSELLKNKAEVIVFNMREKKCNPCMACAFCQGKDTQKCVQKDDIAALLPDLNTCDAIVMATPIYNQQINSQAKLFIERFYPFFKFDAKNMSNSSKQGKKAALVCSFWGSPLNVTQKYADWTVLNFGQMGAEQFRTYLFNNIPEKAAVKANAKYVEKIHELASWLIS